MFENTPQGAAGARVTAEGRLRVALRRAVRLLRSTGVHESLANSIERDQPGRGALAATIGHGQFDLSDFDGWASSHGLDELDGVQAVRGARCELARAQLLLEALTALNTSRHKRASWLMGVAGRI